MEFLPNRHVPVVARSLLPLLYIARDSKISSSQAEIRRSKGYFVKNVQRKYGKSGRELPGKLFLAILGNCAFRGKFIFATKYFTIL